MRQVRITRMLRLITWETWRELDAPILEQKILQSEGMEGNDFTFRCLGWEQDSRARARVRETAPAKSAGAGGLGASSHAVSCVGMSVQFTKGKRSSLPFVLSFILWHLHHDEFLLLFLNLSCNRYHTAFEFSHECFLYQTLTVLFIVVSQFLRHPLIHSKCLINSNWTSKLIYKWM